MRCDHPDCTGNHNDRKPGLCPRSQADKRVSRRKSYWRHREKKLDSMARYRTTSGYMLAQVRYEASRRGGRSRATTE